MIQVKPSTPACASFNAWRIGLRQELRECRRHRTTSEVLVDVATVEVQSRAFAPWLLLGDADEEMDFGWAENPPEEFAWRHTGYGPEGDAASLNEAENVLVLNRIAESVDLRLDPQHWRALSLNPVLHPQFGPNLTVATNGVEVICFSAPAFGADWFMCSRSNLVGPVTGTPLSEWNWLKNQPKLRFTRPQGAQATPKAKKLSRKAQLLADL